MKKFILKGAKEILSVAADYSKWIALFTGLTALILYVAGCKKAGKAVPISIVVYGLIRVIQSCLTE